MEKFARKPSNDPVQERLRQNKATWNKEVSVFINDLIHFKKMMNGWPSKFYKERSRITDAIPADPATIIGSLAGDFQDLVNKSNGIIQEQINYAKNRKQKQPKPASPTNAPPSPNTTAPESSGLNQELARGASSLFNEELIVEGSNPFSRFFHRLLEPGFGSSKESSIKRYRISLVNTTLQIYKDLKKLQSQIVESNPRSIFISHQLFNKIENNFNFLNAGINYLANNTSKEEISIENNTSNSTDPLAAIVQDIKAYSNNFSNVSAMPALRDLARQYQNAKLEDKVKKSEELLKLYKHILVDLSNEKNIPLQQSLSDIFNTKQASAVESLQIVAQNILGKWKQEMFPSDKTSAYRIDVYNNAKEARKITNSIMDSLEKSLNVNELSTLVNQLSTYISNIKNLVSALNSTIGGLGYQSQFINMLEKGRLGDHDINLNPKQKTHLERLLDQKQLRDLTKMYSGK